MTGSRWIALALFVHTALNGLFSLLTKVKKGGFRIFSNLMQALTLVNKEIKPFKAMCANSAHTLSSRNPMHSL